MRPEWLKHETMMGCAAAHLSDRFVRFEQLGRDLLFTRSEADRDCTARRSRAVPPSCHSPEPAPSPPALRSAPLLPTRSSPVAVGHTALPVPLRPPVSCPPVATTPCPTHSELDAVARHLSQQVLCRLVEVVTLETASNGAAVWSQSEAGKGDRGRQGRSRWPREIERAECD